MDRQSSRFEVRLARDERDLRAAQRLRYQVFVEELGGDGPLVDHEQRLERDALDPHFDHLLLVDRQREQAGEGHVVGVYRLLPGDRAAAIGGFYSAAEYDLAPLIDSGRRLLELGRSCLHRELRGTAAMHLLWNGLADYVLSRGFEILFGVASFHGADPAPHREALAWLHHHHLAPEDLRVRARGEPAVAMDTLPADRLDRRRALDGIPSLVKAYLRLGGFVGEGAWRDRAFNTLDVCLVLDTARMSERHRAFYVGGRAREG